MVIKRVKKSRRNQLGDLFRKKGFKKGVEVGVCTGKFSEELCKRIPNVELYGVDDYDINELRQSIKGVKNQELIYQDAINRLKPYKNYTFIRKKSMEAVLDFPLNSIDFVYIDGGHQFDYVMCDIIEWGKRVKKGGIISGHDFYYFRHGDIIKAVETYANVHRVETVCTTNERCPSFWFEKTW